MVLGWLNIAFCLWAVLGIAMAMLMFLLRDTALGAGARIYSDNPAFAAWTKTSLWFSGVGGCLLLVSGIGLLRWKPWARILAIGYAIYAILLAIASAIVTFVLLIRPMLEQFDAAAGPEAIGVMTGAVGAVIGALFSLAYPIVLLVFMTRPKIVAAFRPVTGTPPLPTGAA